MKKIKPKYNSLLDWYNADRKAYAAAQRKGMLQEICNKLDWDLMRKKWDLEKCKAEALKYESRSKWRKNSASSYDCACKNNWLDECCLHMIKLRKSHRYWTEETCIAEALKYKSYSDWKKNNVNSYNWSLRLDALDKIYEITGWEKKVGIWTLEKCKKEALKHEFVSWWQKKSSGSYKAANKNGWMDECTAHMNKEFILTHHWTLEECKKEALKYKTKSEWFRKSPGSYQASHRYKWINKCDAHMQKPRRWTLEECKKDALKYKTKSEWLRKSPRGYHSAHRNDWLEKCYTHMIELSKPNGFWTYKNCKEEALKYKTKIEWLRKSPGSYRKSQREKWIEKLSQHMKSRLWTLEKSKIEALKYKTKKKWSNSSHSSYAAACRNNWIDICCQHMLKNNE
jgi:hypothetical protein